MEMSFAEDDLPLPSFCEVFGYCSPRGKRKGIFEDITTSSTGRWTNEERLQFLEGLKKYGKDFKKIKTLIQSRSMIQIRTHAQKILKCDGGKISVDNWDFDVMTSFLDKEIGAVREIENISCFGSGALTNGVEAQF